MSKKVGFISFRFSGVDGVTLETEKWVEIFERIGWECFFCAGECAFSKHHTLLNKSLHFATKDIISITQQCFKSETRSPSLTEKLHEKRVHIKKILYSFIKEFDLDLLVLQNILAIPMNIPLSMAATEVITETQIPTIAHHHDFYWERDRYKTNCVQDILGGCFPPSIPNVVHVTINTIALQQLSYRTGISSILVPNVMEFEKRTEIEDTYANTFRKDIGISENDICILQPTRIVQRKGIENSIEIAHRLSKKNKKAILVISHASGDEGDEYQNRVLEYAKIMNVTVKLIASHIGKHRGRKNGKKIYSLNDVYNQANIVTYPSILEGFGNAFLEAIYFNRPIIVNQYPVYITDIKPKGFNCIEFTNFVSEKTILEIKDILSNKQKSKKMTSENYNRALKYYSFSLLNKKITDILNHFYGI